MLEITEVEIMMHSDPAHPGVLAFARVVLADALAVNDLKVIRGADRRFVSMPSRDIRDRCPACDARNPLASRHCHRCGRRLKDDRAQTDHRGKPLLRVDVAYPIGHEFRAKLEAAVLAAYDAEVEARRAA